MADSFFGKIAAKLTPGRVVFNLISSLALVLATYNTWDYSAYHWVTASFDYANFRVWGVILLVLAAHTWCIYATFEGLPTPFKILLVAGIVVAVGLAFQENWVSTGSITSLEWLGILILSAVYTIGRSFAYVYRKDTGQVMGDTTDGGE